MARASSYPPMTSRHNERRLYRILLRGHDARPLQDRREAPGFGWAPLNGDGYIGPWLGAIRGSAILWLLVRRPWRAPGLPLLVGGYLVLLFALEYFGRFMIDTALGYLAVLAPLSFFLSSPSTVAHLTLLPLPSPDEETAIAV